MQMATAAHSGTISTTNIRTATSALSHSGVGTLPASPTPTNNSRTEGGFKRSKHILIMQRKTRKKKIILKPPASQNTSNVDSLNDTNNNHSRSFITPLDTKKYPTIPLLPPSPSPHPHPPLSDHQRTSSRLSFQQQPPVSDKYSQQHDESLAINSLPPSNSTNQKSHSIKKQQSSRAVPPSDFSQGTGLNLHSSALDAVKAFDFAESDTQILKSVWDLVTSDDGYTSNTGSSFLQKIESDRSKWDMDVLVELQNELKRNWGAIKRETQTVDESPSNTIITVAPISLNASDYDVISSTISNSQIKATRPSSATSPAASFPLPSSNNQIPKMWMPPSAPLPPATMPSPQRLSLSSNHQNMMPTPWSVTDSNSHHIQIPPHIIQRPTSASGSPSYTMFRSLKNSAYQSTQGNKRNLTKIVNQPPHPLPPGYFLNSTTHASEMTMAPLQVFEASLPPNPSTKSLSRPQSSIRRIAEDPPPGGGMGTGTLDSSAAALARALPQQKKQPAHPFFEKGEGSYIANSASTAGNQHQEFYDFSTKSTQQQQQPTTTTEGVLETTHFAFLGGLSGIMDNYHSSSISTSVVSSTVVASPFALQTQKAIKSIQGATSHHQLQPQRQPSSLSLPVLPISSKPPPLPTLNRTWRSEPNLVPSYNQQQQQQQKEDSYLSYSKMLEKRHSLQDLSVSSSSLPSTGGYGVSSTNMRTTSVMSTYSSTHSAAGAGGRQTSMSGYFSHSRYQSAATRNSGGGSYLQKVSSFNGYWYL
jgi:hypothetical protein